MYLKFAVQLGNTSIMLPLSAAIATWLVFAKQWRLALVWCVLFATGLGSVIATKMNYLSALAAGYSPDYRGASGHAMLTTSVVPVAISLLLQRCPAWARHSGNGISALLAVCMTVCLVQFEFHSLQEALHGLALGTTVSVGFIWMKNREAVPPNSAYPALLAMLVFALVSYANPAKLEHLLTDLAPKVFFVRD